MEFTTMNRLLNKSSSAEVKHICRKNPKCKNAEYCLSAIEITTFGDVAENQRVYIKGIGGCGYANKEH